MPFVANAQSAVFYPPNLLFWIGDVARAFGLLAVLRLLAAGGFTFLLARTVGMCRAAALFASLAYACCSFLVTWTALPTVVDVAVWLPWALWSMELLWRGRRMAGATCLGFGLGTQFLAGHPQMSVYLLLAVGMRLVAGAASRRRNDTARAAGWTAAAVALGIGLGACQLLPTAELAGHSHRFHGGAKPNPLGRANPQALPVQDLSLFLAPRLLGDPNDGTYYGFAWATGNYADYCGYVGVATLVLAALGVASGAGSSAAVWLAFAAVGLVLSLNPYPAAWLMSRTGVTGATLGSPTRAFLLSSLGLAMLGGWGVHALGRGAGSSRRLSALLVGWTALLFGALLLLGGVVNGTLASVSPGAVTFAQPIQTMALIAAGASLTAVAAISLAALSGRLSPRVGQLLLVGVLATELVGFGYGYNPPGRREEVYPSTQLLTWLQQNAPDVRVMPLNQRWSITSYPPACLPPNAGLVYGLDDLAGYDSLHLAAYKNLAARLQGGSPAPPENGNMLLLSNVQSPLVGVLGAKYAVSREALPGAQSRLRFSGGDAYVYELPNAFPRAFSVPHSADRLTNQLLPEKLAPLRAQATAQSLTRATPNRVRVKVTAPEAGTLILTDVSYPGWRSALDGRPTDTLTRLDVFRAVALPAGAKQVDFAYWPQSVRLGLFLSLVALAMLVCCAARLVFRRAR